MHWFRSVWGSRCLVALVVAGLLPSLLAPAACTARREAPTAYADWLRGQLRAPADEAVETAINQAVTQRPRSLRAFLEAFVAAYDVQRPDAVLGAVFSVDDLPDDALISYLERRFGRLVGDAVLPRILLSAAPSGAASATPDRLAAAAALIQAAAGMLPAAAALAQEDRPFVKVVRTLFAAHPRGP